MLTSFRDDVQIAIKIWNELLLEQFFDDIDYIYVKGSAVKPWKSIIDYVPQISDIDIHVKIRNDHPSELVQPSLETSLKVGPEYEKRFIKFNVNSRRSYNHIPRIQMVLLNNVLDRKFNFVFPRIKDIHILYGEPHFPEEVSGDYIRNQDREELLKLPVLLQKSYKNLLDRSDPLEMYILLRRICFVISPSPVRLLTQLLQDQDPYDIWTWNRSTIKQNLEVCNLRDLASEYSQYYTLGWDLYNKKFQDTDLFVKVIVKGLSALQLVYNEIIKF